MKGIVQSADNSTLIQKYFDFFSEGLYNRIATFEWRHSEKRHLVGHCNDQQDVFC